MAYRELLPDEALARFEAGGVVLLDVRTPLEWQGARVPGSVHIPLDELTVRYEELDPAAETLVLCAHGVRSAAAGQWLAQAGFENVANVRYGLCRWPGSIDVGHRQS